MRAVRLDGAGAPLRSILCLGAHADDIEIGCGGTVLTLLARHPRLEVHWVVFSADATREQEARQSAELFLRTAGVHTVTVQRFRDSFFPYIGADIKAYFEELKRELSPDLIFTHYGADRHQDHRLIAELTWNTWRNHLVLEYEILKYEGDLGQPNAYMHVPAALARRKVAHLQRHFASQRSKAWFAADNFLGLMRLRGLECRAPSGFAEAFHARKFVL